jgi:hypothetical protein
MARKLIETVILGRLFTAAISKDWSGFNGGIFQLKIISSSEVNQQKALRLVIYRFVFWLSLQKVVI